MKLLWIVNLLLGPLCRKLNNKESNGLWMSAFMNTLKERSDCELVIASTASVPQTVREEEDGVVYYALPDKPPMLYDENKPANLKAWRALLDSEKPDLIEIWGTEFTHGLCALKEAGDIPSIIRMQGYVSAIAKHYLAGMTPAELRSSLTFRDIVTRDGIARQQQKYFRAAKKEAEMIELSQRVICQNGWGEKLIKAQHPDAEVYFCPLSIGEAFFNSRRDSDKTEPYSIMCNAAGYSLKGLHVLLRAVALLKNKYPAIKLFVPGYVPVSDGSFSQFLRKRGYSKYIEKLIRQLGVQENVVWLGRMTQEELARQYATKSLFVLGSSIENQSGSLIEAMIVGLPVISSAVGEIPEFIKDGENGLLYRFGEHDVLSVLIDRIFSDKELSLRLAEHGCRDMRKEHDPDRINEIMLGIYSDVIAGGVSS